MKRSTTAFALTFAIILAASGAASAQSDGSATNQIVNYILLERGYASWYGQEFDGRKTSNGEIFDSNKLTAAHKTLPFNTRVRVTNLSTGRNVVVRINDRGPFVEGRNIDLSRAAAENIGIIGSGVAAVSIEIEAPSPTPQASGGGALTGAGTVGSSVGAGNGGASPSPSVAPIVIENPTRVIQVAAFGNQPNSQKLIATLQLRGINASEEAVAATPSANALYRVVIRDVAIPAIDKVLSALAQLGYSEVLIRQK
jgi:rare lipoprotein A